MAALRDRPLVMEGQLLRVEYSLSGALKLSHRKPEASSVSVPSSHRPQNHGNCTSFFPC
jgi:hypothetical protein